MTFFIYEDGLMKDDVIPGTVFLDEETNEDLLNSTLKTLPGTTIVLQPQPSDSLRDPYNWTSRKKYTYFFGILLSSIGAAIIGPLLGPGFGVLAVYFDESLDKIIQINGSLILTLGISSYVCNQLCCVFGKRPLFMLTAVVTFASIIWAANARSYASIIGARVVQGLGMGMTFSAAGTVSISDVFFVHERARVVGIWSFTILFVNSVTPIISGYVIENLNWRWTFGFLAIYNGIAMLYQFFFVPESGFVRSIASNSIISPTPTTESLVEKIINKKDNTSSCIIPVEIDEISNKRESYYSTLSIYSGRKSSASIIQVLSRPLLLLQNPIIIWGILQWCFCYIWVILIGTTSSQMFSSAPYNLSVSQTGVLVGVAPLIGVTIGALTSGVCSDYLVDVLARQNNGVYEPEFRLFIMVPYAVLVAIGGFTLACEYGNESDIVVAVFIAILFCGVAFGCTGIITYTVDTMDFASGEAFGVMMLFKSIFAFGLLFSITDWFASKGAKNQYCVMSGITVAVALLSVPMYIFGKKNRHYMKYHSWYSHTD